MNLFLPYVNDVKQSVRSLDNKRLLKQIIECKQILTTTTPCIANHPVVKHYREFPAFVSHYAALCCEEYFFRFNKHHACENEFKKKLFTPKFVPLYASGSAKLKNCVRETDPKLVSTLFQMKLCNKFYTDTNPNWGVRGMPDFYKNYLNALEEVKRDAD